MDLSIIKMNYEAALALKRRGLLPKEDIDLYRPHLWQKYDVDMFLGFLQEDREEIEYPRLFDLIKSKFCFVLIFLQGRRRSGWRETWSLIQERHGVLGFGDSSTLRSRLWSRARTCPKNISPTAPSMARWPAS